MYYKDHLPPHFHAEYQNAKAVFDLDGEIIEGDFPPSKARMVAVWAEIHQEELLANWKLATEKRELFRIDPLR